VIRIRSSGGIFNPEEEARIQRFVPECSVSNQKTEPESNEILGLIVEMKKLCAVCVIACIYVASAMSQETNRFPAPLGIDRVLTGVIAKAKPGSAPDPNSKRSQFTMSSGDIVYALHGHEKELKKLAGKQARITGTVVGNDVAVTTVEPAKTN
jgi:hypothetical protein